MKPCTRSLTCKTHQISLRRNVEGRSKPFDQLLADHRNNAKETHKHSSSKQVLKLHFNEKEKRETTLNIYLRLFFLFSCSSSSSHTHTGQLFVGR